MSSFADHVALEEIDLTWDQLRYTVKVKGDNGPVDKVLLKGVSGTARRCRTLAVMGPSGAGKSTFLNGISGRLAIDADHRMDGTAYLNDAVFLTRYKPLMSYVAQDDIVMGKDTPREALTFSYRMRSAASAEEAEAKVKETLELLSLTKCADTFLGIPGLLKGVSGGEKKRTNIGSELINNPLILLLDEPTTGLDSVNALRVGLLLKELAHTERRTVLCTIHTPSSELFDTFDDLLLLAKGRVIYHGAREDALKYFRHAGHPVPHLCNPSEHYMQVLQLPEETLENLANVWLDYCKTEEGSKNLSVNQTPANAHLNGDAHFDRLLKDNSVSCLTEFSLLTARSWRVTMRDPAGTVGKFVQALFFAVLLALFFANMDKDDQGVQDRSGVLFMEVINLTFLNVMTAITVFPPERAVFLQEQANATYNAYLYYVSKVVAEIPLCLVIPTIYSIITYWSWGLVNTAVAYFNHLAIVLAVSYMGNSFGMFAATLFPRPEIAFTLTPLFLMPQMIVAGLFANTDRLEPYWVWLNYISFPRYAYKAMMVNEFSNIGPLCGGNTNSTAGGSCRYTTGAEVLKYNGFDKETDTVWFCIVLLLIINFVFRVLGATALYVQGRMARSELVFENNFRRSTGKASDAIEMH